jgi:hypothetical protein
MHKKGKEYVLKLKAANLARTKWAGTRLVDFGLTQAQPVMVLNRPELARSMLYVVLRHDREPIGRAQHDPFNSVRSDPVVGPFSSARHRPQI